jgi:hypothetical protein
MKVALKLNGIKEIVLTPISEDWKEYSQLLKDGETYKIERLNNSVDIVLKQVKETPISVLNVKNEQ